MKTNYLVIVCLIVLSLISCKAKESDNLYQNTYEDSSKASSIHDSKNNDRFIYDVHGIIVAKHTEQGCDTCDKHHFFTIRLDTYQNSPFDWEVSRAKWYNKEVDDKVFFEYLLKKRLSDKALD